MLEKLLENSKKASVAGFFLVNPPRAFFAGELEARLGGKELASELSQLIKIGFLTSFAKKGKRYYAVNERTNGYRELRDSVLKAAPSYEDELFKFIKKLDSVQYAVLTGLFMGDPDAGCDVVLVGNPKPGQIEKFVAGIQKLAGQEVNYAIFSPEEFGYRRNTFDRFTKDVFDNRHLVVVDKLR
jgi:hypothetical protein